MEMLLILVLCVPLVLSQKIGENCRLSNDMPGICRPTYKCPRVMKEWSQGIVHDLCGFKGRKPIVCCPEHEEQTRWRSITKCAEYAQDISKIRNRTVRSIGGLKTMPQEFSHMAALGYINGNSIVWNCGGTLISDQYILTAAHCLRDRQYGDVQFVRLGDLFLDGFDNVDNSLPQDFLVAERISYPNYVYKEKYNDIALLRLNKRVQFSRHVHPACLHSEPTPVPPQLTALGWGTAMEGPTNLGSDSAGNANSLMKVDLEVYSDEACKLAYGKLPSLPRGIQTMSQICAGGKHGIKDTCKGDSGAPLLTATGYHPNLHYVVGVTSFGRPCGSSRTPGVYMRVSHYVQWIESIVWP